MSIDGQGHFFTIYFPGFVCFVLYYAMISGERLQDQWSSGYAYLVGKEEFGYFVILTRDVSIEIDWYCIICKCKSL